jgi:hypothetical protein
MKVCKLKWALACILGILLCAGYVAKAQSTSPPANNNCQNAIAIGEVVNRAFNTTNATFDGPGHCMTSPNIWYRYTATRTGNATVSLCGSSFDTVLAVYRGSECYPQQSNVIGCNDDACGRQSELSFDVVAGSQYLIEVGGFGANTGQGVLTVRLEGGEPPPSGLTNNDCRNATQIGNVTNLAFDTTIATFDGSGYCVTSPNIWYCYTAPRTGSVTVSLCGSSYDTMLAVYNGCTCNPSRANMIKCNDDFCGLQSEVTFEAIGGNRYLIEIGGCTDSDWGRGVLNIRSEGGEPTPSRPVNDNCSQATAIGNVTRQTFSTVNATFDGAGRCMASPNIWYIYTATCTGDVTVSLCGSSYDTKLGVYNKNTCPPGSSDLIKCNDDACGWQSEVTFAGTVGRQYLIEVGGFGSSTGQGVISIRCEGIIAQAKSDLGDAPDSSNNFSRNMTAYPKGGPSGVRAYYPTVFSDGWGAGPYGPIHLNALAVAHLGKKITDETEADKDSDEDGVNNINPQTNSSDQDKGDDGVTLPLILPKCRWTTFDYFVNVIDPDTHLWVNVWCDWNRDGDWDDDSNTNPTLVCSKGFVSEWVVKNQYIFNLPAGLNRLTTPAFLPWHPATGTKQIWMRITVSEQPWINGSAPGQRGNGGSGPEDGYEIGETEDYYFTPDTTGSICEDYNGDGKINLADLAAFTTDWLEYCPQ